LSTFADLLQFRMQPRTFYITNIGRLYCDEEGLTAPLKGASMSQLPFIESAWLLIENGKFHSWGSMSLFPETSISAHDATNGWVIPAWCDSHTHLVYAGSRETEFVARINGLTYEEIAQQGGGIINSALRLRNTTEDQLYDSALIRLHEIIQFGTGAVEIKSGYGLDLESELKMLRVIRRLKSATNCEIRSNFLAAHAVPPEYKGRQDDYVNHIINDMLPKVVEEGLADFIDVFCDRGFFTQGNTEKILSAGMKYGLRGKIHANELDYSGGVQAGVKYGALSVDHLECVGEAEITALLNSQTISTVLPSTSFFLKLPYAPARKMIDAGLPLSLATDYNPGSSPSGRMSFILSLACIHMNMLPEEAVNAATINGACAMGVEMEFGSIAKNKFANCLITQPLENLAYIPYSFGSDLVKKVILKGEMQ